MKSYLISKLLESISTSKGVVLEAVAKNQMNVDGVYVTPDLPVVRVIDYLTVGFKGGFTRDGNNAGSSEKAKSAEGGWGNHSAHTVNVNSCVNIMMKNTASFGKVFSGLKLSSLYVPRIPSEFKDNVDAEWDFLESCPAVAQSANKMIKWTNSVSSTTAFEEKIDPAKTRFYSASIIYGYVNDEQELAAVIDGAVKPLKLKSEMINTDPTQKYLDAEFETDRPKALELLKKIHAAKSADYAKAAEGTPDFDIKNTIDDFKSLVPVDGNVFLSSNEIQKYISLFNYFTIDEAERKQQGGFNNKLALGVQKLEDKGIHFGPQTGVASDMENIILNGGYTITLGAVQDGDKTHTEVFHNENEKIFTGYITYMPRAKQAQTLIPIYIATKNESEIAKLTDLLEKKVPIDKVDLKNGAPKIGFQKLNTEGHIKRTGDNFLIFQLPQEIYSLMYTKPAEEKKAKAEPKAPKAPKTPKEQAAKPEQQDMFSQQTKPAEEVKPSEPAPQADVTPEGQPTPPEEQASSQASNPPTENQAPKAGPVISKYGKMFKDGKVNQEKAIDAIMKELAAIGSKASRKKVEEVFTNKFVGTGVSPTVKKDEYDAMFGVDGANIATGDGPLHSKESMTRMVSELKRLGHSFTPEEINYLAKKSVPARGKYTIDDVNNAVNGGSALTEATRYMKLGSLLESIKKHR